jgi:hypothetical protein
MPEGSSTGEISMLDRPGRIAAALLVFVLGSISFHSLPTIVGTMSDHPGIWKMRIGTIASADMSGMLLAAIATIFWFRRLNWQRLAVGFALCLSARVNVLVASFKQPAARYRCASAS